MGHFIIFMNIQRACFFQILFYYWLLYSSIILLHNSILCYRVSQLIYFVHFALRHPVLLQTTTFDLVSFDLSYFFETKSQKISESAIHFFVDHPYSYPPSATCINLNISYLGFNKKIFFLVMQAQVSTQIDTLKIKIVMQGILLDF